MHVIKPSFAMSVDDATSFASKRGFGVVVAFDGLAPRGSHVPFSLGKTSAGVLVAQVHFTLKNPLVSLADGKTRFLLIVAGADAYVSNDWYVSKDQVSTWLYQAVHLSGLAHLRAFKDNRSHGDVLLEESEARLDKDAWTLENMDPIKREAMLQAIRVVDIVIDQIEGQSKLNQHKGDQDHVAVANVLALSGDTRGRELAESMRLLRPNLTYDFAAD